MILADGKHIQGIFVFDKTAKYEKGDFIVDGDCLYICTSGEPIQSDIRPSENLDYFAPYPGNKIASLEEYNSYIASPDGKEDKYVSSSVLNAVLQQGYYGFGDTGMITAYISEKTKKINGEEKYIIDTSIYGLKDRLVDNTKLLDIVMSQPDLNNAYITVDRNLPELKNILPSGTNCCILRQYTYVDINNMGTTDKTKKVYVNYRYRVQELMDFQTGTVFYRYTIGTRANGSSTWQYTGTISDWRSLVVSTALLNKMNDIIQFYNEDRSRETQISASDGYGTVNKFNFRELLSQELDSSNTRNLVREANSSVSDGIAIPGIKSGSDEGYNFETTDLFIVVNVKIPTTTGGKLFKSYSTTINTRDAANTTGQLEYYYLDDDVLLQVIYTASSSASDNEKYISLRVTDSSRQVLYSGANINSIYFRDTRNE